MKAAVVLGCAVAFLGGGFPVPAANERAPEKGKAAAPVPAPAAAPGSGVPGAGANPGQLGDQSVQGLGAFGKMLPLGQRNVDVKVPSFRDGVPSSFLRAATMTRLDDEHMEMEQLDIRMYGPVRERDLRIKLHTASYHMPTEVLSSNERSRISREDFDLQGDTLIFDTRTQQGKMTGHIHMVIHDSDSLRQQPDKKTPPPAKGAADPKAPAGAKNESKGKETSETEKK